MSERRRLVTDFAELREGMKVTFVGECIGCGKGNCKAMVLGDPGVPCVCGKKCVELTTCDGIPNCICPGNVEAKEVYRVLDGLEDSQLTERELERVR